MACSDANDVINFYKSSGLSLADPAAACMQIEGCGLIPSCVAADGFFPAPGTDTCIVSQTGNAMQTAATCSMQMPLLNNGTAYAGGCAPAALCMTKPEVNPCTGYTDPWTCNAQDGNCE